MRILFKEDNTGNKEVKELLGFIDADLRVVNMKSEIISATDEMIEEVGEAVYSFAERCYYDELLPLVPAVPPDTPEVPAEVLDENFLYRIRYAIILRAYAAYAPLNDLKHTSNGRLMRSDEYQKSPFEWQVVRSDVQLEKKYYQALDILITYLEKENVANWKQGAYYKIQKQLLVSNLSDFRNVYEIDNRYLYKRLVPGLLQAQEKEVQPRVGKETLILLQKYTKGEIQISEIDPVVLRLARDIMVFHALSWGMERFSVTLLPDRVVQQYFSSNGNIRASMPPPALQAEAAAQRFRADRDMAIASLETHLAPVIPVDELPDTPLYRHLMGNDDLFVS